MLMSLFSRLTLCLFLTTKFQFNTFSSCIMLVAPMKHMLQVSSNYFLTMDAKLEALQDTTEANQHDAHRAIIMHFKGVPHEILNVNSDSNAFGCEFLVKFLPLLDFKLTSLSTEATE